MLKLVVNNKDKLQDQRCNQQDGKKIETLIAEASNGLSENYFTNTPGSFFSDTRFFQKRRKRVVLQKGIDNISVSLEAIAFFYSENKITYAIDHSGTKYIAEINLIELEKELDTTFFFRANRQFIINLNYIKSFRNYERVKIKVTMTPEDLNGKYVIIISQDRSRVFRQWIYTA